VREALRALPGDLADVVARHLVATERALGDEDPNRAYEHAKAARRFAARIGVVREAVGVAGYRAGHYAEALGDLRAARRMTGSDDYLPIMADCERGLGRPERALDLIRSKEAERLDRPSRVELAIVESGARRDLGQQDAAVITLQRLAELRDPRPQPWSARLAFAYADALADAGHLAAATEWFGRALAFDEHGETDAAERYAQLTGGVVEDIQDVEEEFDGELDEEAGSSGMDDGGSEEDLALDMPAGEDPESRDDDGKADLPADLPETITAVQAAEESDEKRGA
jgi:tetratricopeptide (TPR) repeat protein